MNRPLLRCAMLCCLVAARAAAAQDWPEFRGPTGQGHSTEQGLPLEWSESRNVLWKSPVPGSGWSSPVVGGGRVWMTTAVPDRGGISLRAVAFDAETGREAVNVEVFRVDRPGPINPKNGRASPTPILDGDRVYVHFGMDGTAALTTAGDIVWRTRLPYESQHGSGGSPALFRDLLIVNCDGNGGDAFVAALDTRTGKTRWKTRRRDPADQAYSTPLVIRAGDRDELISVGAYRAEAYDPATGKEIWRVTYEEGFSNVPRPVYAHGLVYIATGFQQPSLLAVRADGSGDVTKTHVAWALRRAAPYTPSPLAVGDDLYVVNDAGIASCLDAVTGAARWVQRLGGTFSASPVYADGRIYFVSEDSVTTVIAPGPVFRVLALNRLDGATLASMAVSLRSIFMRTDSHLYRIGLRSLRPHQGWPDRLRQGSGGSRASEKMMTPGHGPTSGLSCLRGATCAANSGAGMTTDYAALEQTIVDTLGLPRPVAVTYLDSPPAGVARFSGTMPSGCSFWKLAGNGNGFYTVPGDHLNCPIGSYTHGIDPPPDRAAELGQALSLMAGIGYVRMEEIPSIPRLAKSPAVIYYAPLSATVVDPDVVIVAGRPGALMRLQEAAARAGAASTLPLLGRPTCMALPAALAHGSVMSSGCVGNRVYTGRGEDELYLMIPGRLLGAIIDQLATIEAANGTLASYHDERRKRLTTIEHSA